MTSSLEDKIWPEVRQARNDKRHELILSGSLITERLKKEEGIIDKNLFNLESLNYLNINDTALDIVPEEIGVLENLTTLVLHSNKISKLPDSVGKLSKLKVLDVSRNKLRVLPDNFSALKQLSTVNLGSNLLKELPFNSSNVKLSIIDISNNDFDKFPNICYPELVHLAEVRLNGNKIKDIPGNINQLTSLKLLDISDNLINIVPKELSDCNKLKELNLKGNPISDKRLYKLIEQCRTKQVLDYVRQNCNKAGDAVANAGTVGGSKSKKGKKGRKISETNDGNVDNLNTDKILKHKLRVLKVNDDNPVVQITDDVKSVRPYIVICIIKNLKFNEDSLKRFIQLQSKYHEGICEKRNAATIATHDFNSINPGNLTYTAKPPKEIEIKPLMREKVFTGEALFQRLQTEADNLRREKKRNVYSGVHRYLYLLEGKSKYPCLIDSSDKVISLPPITNSDLTKISIETKSVLLEVTSATSQQICRKIADQFLCEIVSLGLGCTEDDNEKIEDYHNLVVEQVKIVDLDGNMKHVYPSRSDLIFEDNNNVSVIRE